MAIAAIGATAAAIGAGYGVYAGERGAAAQRQSVRRQRQESANAAAAAAAEQQRSEEQIAAANRRTANPDSILATSRINDIATQLTGPMGARPGQLGGKTLLGE